MHSAHKHHAVHYPDPLAQARELELNRRVQASSYMLIFSIAITGTLGIFSIMSGELLQAAVMAGVSLVILGAYIGVHLAGPSHTAPILVGVLLLVLYFYLLLTGGMSNTELLWAVMLVPGFINLYGYRWGALTLLFVGGATALVLYYPQIADLPLEHDPSHLAHFIAVFGALTLLTATLDSSRHKTQQMLHTLTKEMESRASTDALTGLANRREAYRAMHELERRNRHLSGRYTVLIGDLDNFKHINDTYGHAFGDRVLQDVAEVLRDNTRADDIVARWGGEEFLVLLPNTDVDGGGILAEKLRNQVEALSGSYSPPVKISISFGVAEGDPASATHGQLLAEADARMYRAKDGGRNQVVSV